MRHHRSFGIALLVVAAIARPARAQEEPPIETGFEGGAAASYLALTLTPVGALAPMHDFLIRRPDDPPMPLPMRLHVSLGSLDRGPGVGQRTVAATLDMPMGATALSLTAGYLDVTCDEDATGGFDLDLSCRGGVTLGARVGAPFWSRVMDAAGTSALVLGIEGSAGYADIDVVQFDVFGTQFDVKGQGMSVAAALPLALVVRTGTTLVSPSIRPAIGWGRAKVDFGDGQDDAESGVRGMIGAGVAVRLGVRLGFDFGLQRVFYDDAETTLGAAVSFGF